MTASCVLRGRCPGALRVGLPSRVLWRGGCDGGDGLFIVEDLGVGKLGAVIDGGVIGPVADAGDFHRSASPRGRFVR